MSRSFDVLADREKARRAENTVLRTAIVAAVDAASASLTITLGGTDLPGIPYLATGATPGVGAPVAVLQTGTQLLVLGAIARPSA